MVKLKKASPKYFKNIKSFVEYNYISPKSITQSDLNPKYDLSIEDGVIVLWEDTDYINLLDVNGNALLDSNNKQLKVRGI